MAPGLRVDYQRWGQFFEELFARFFGNRHLSFKCVTRSFLLSTILVAAIWLFFSLPELKRFGRLVLPELDAVVDCITDYLTLWKTRILLTKSHLLNKGLSLVNSRCYGGRCCNDCYLFRSIIVKLSYITTSSWVDCRGYACDNNPSGGP